ncbi:MAG: hypothetical protein AB7D57_01590 [Desulfovibrionaceae bacterium]
MIRAKRFTARVRERFLEALRSTGSVSAGARACGISRGRLYDLRRTDPDLAQAWDETLAEALADRTEALEAEAFRRAVDGVDRPYFFQGQECGRVREYSDSLMKFLLQTQLPGRYAPGGGGAAEAGGEAGRANARGAAVPAAPAPAEPRVVIELHLGPEVPEPEAGAGAESGGAAWAAVGTAAPADRAGGLDDEGPEGGGPDDGGTARGDPGRPLPAGDGPAPSAPACVAWSDVPSDTPSGESAAALAAAPAPARRPGRKSSEKKTSSFNPDKRKNSKGGDRG